MSEIVQARLRHVFGLRTGALFFFLGGSKGAVLDPPNVLFFAVPELESCWGSAVSEPCLRRCFCSRITYGAGRQSFKVIASVGNSTYMVSLVGNVRRNIFCVLETIKMHFRINYCHFYFMLVPKNVGVI